MCGLAGYLLVDDTAPVPGAEVCAALGRLLAHRGPDGEGSYRSRHGRAALVHRRLSIIDLTPGADQPMSFEDGRYQLVFNGEVYNYRALRKDLEARGERFATESDTEVLLRLLVREGTDALHRVRGMFACALWDDRARSLLVARDRFGIKPLYVAEHRGRVAFASEVGALWRSGLIERRVSPAGILAYLFWASVPPPLTWLDDVRGLSPGTWERWVDGRHDRGTFADSSDAFMARPSPVAEADLRDRVGAAVRDAVRAHLVADVPVGVFLSGGIDSSSIVSAARSVTNDALRTYTVVMSEADYSEEAHARRVAEHFGTTHHELRVEAGSLHEDLPHIVRHLDQPTADAINSYYVSRAVASTGLKAVLSGTGADEMFGGYPSFRRLPRAARLGRWAGPLMSAIGAGAGLRMPSWRRAMGRHFCAAGTMQERYRAQRGLFMPEEMSQVAGPALRSNGTWKAAIDAVQGAERAVLGVPDGEAPEAAVARLETRQYLGSQLLRDIDAMSMAHSLEVRVPFVDHELLGTVWPDVGVHPHLLRGKRLLYETLERPLPPSTYGRPKQGFTLPFAEWMRGPLGEVIRDGLVHVAREGWVASSVPEELWRQWTNGEAHWSRPWALGMLGLFLRA